MNHIHLHRFSGITTLADLRKILEHVQNWPPGYSVAVHNHQIEIWQDTDTP